MKARKIAAMSAIAALGLGGALVATSAASAHDKSVDLSCTSIGITLSNYPAGSTVGGTIDGVELGTSTFGPEGFSYSQPLDPAVPHTYSVVVKSGDGNYAFNVNESGKSDPACIPVVVPPTTEPTPPVVTPPVVVDVIAPKIQDYLSCDGAAFVLDNTGSNVDVTYTISGTEYPVAAGTALHTDADGTLLAPSGNGWTITAADETWSFVALGEDDCPVTAEPPVVVPPTDTPTTPAPTPTAPEPTATPTAAAPAPTGPALVVADATPSAARTAAPVADGLAYTGTDPLGTGIGIGVGLLALAGGLALLFRRRIAAGLRR
jgi:hypothetical protein